MGKASSKYRKKSRPSVLLTNTGPYYASPNMRYVTKSVPSVSETTHDFSRTQEKSGSLTMNYDDWLYYGYAPNKLSWYNGDFSTEAATVQVPKAGNVFATDTFNVHSRSERPRMKPRLITSLNKDPGSDNLLTYFLDRIGLY